MSILPPVFGDLTPNMHEFTPLKSAILAISASHMVHVEASLVSGVAVWVEQWLRRLQDYGVAVEDGMPIGMMRRMMGLVKKRKEDEQDLLMLSMLADEDTEKSDLYRSDFKVLAALCGKDRRNGKLYNDVVYTPTSVALGLEQDILFGLV